MNKIGQLAYMPWWWLRAAVFGRRKPLQSVLFISDRCNLSCRHCSVYNHETPADKSTEQIRECMERHQIRVLEHRNDTVWHDSSFIIVSGVRNPFDLKANGISPTLALHDSDFVILLTHTPDYVEDVPVPHTDLALAGHTHGGQVSFFRLWTPQTGSKYGSRLLTGRRTDSHGLPVIITNGLGTSRLPVRFCSPSEIVEITLKREYSDNRNGL